MQGGSDRVGHLFGGRRATKEHARPQVSFHHAREVHGSDFNLSDRPRRLLVRPQCCQPALLRLVVPLARTAVRLGSCLRSACSSAPCSFQELRQEQNLVKSRILSRAESRSVAVVWLLCRQEKNHAQQQLSGCCVAR